MHKLKTYLSQSKITQADFAKVIGVKQPTVSDWINGEMRPSIDNLLAISKATGISLDDLVLDFNSSSAPA